MMRAVHLFFLLLAATATIGWVGGCGAAPAEALRPSDPTYEQAVGESSRCEGIGQTAEPLLVDVRPEFRGDVEVAMRGGVAVVRYDCAGLQLLKECSAEGSYGYLPTVTKRQAVQLANADEIRANLPVKGAGIAAQLGAELRRGASLDVALIMVGKRATTRTRVSGEDLSGSCKGATHFVRRATVGAFAMNVGTRAQVRSAAQVFAAGVRAESSSRKTMRNQDGDPDTCDDATTNDAAPPDQCGALLRLELVAIAGDDGSEPADAVVRSTACPKGYAMGRGKCVRSDSDESAHACTYGNKVACEHQCKQGSGESCSNLGAMYYHGYNVPQDDELAVELFDKACERGIAAGCHNLGLMVATGRGAERDPKRAAKLFKLACNAGEGSACNNLGAAHEKGEGVEQDSTRALGLFKRACNGGDAAGCFNVALVVEVGHGVAKDLAQAAKMYARACDGGQQDACLNLAFMYVSGNGVPQDVDRAFKLNASACDHGLAKACTALGALAERVATGEQRTELLGKAAGYYRRSCKEGSADACAGLARMYETGTGVAESRSRAFELYSRGCKLGSGNACYSAGLAAMLGSGTDKDNAVAAGLFERGCEVKDTRSGMLQEGRNCQQIALMYRRGLGVTTDERRARTYYQRACDQGMAIACREVPGSGSK
jgi:TPR repeat protein